MPQTFGTITVSDGISQGTEGMKYSLVSREVIADSIETVCQAQSVDGLVAIGGCDKNMPGAMIAIARLNIPVDLCLWRNDQARTLRGEDLTSSARLKLWASSAPARSARIICSRSSATRVPVSGRAAACSPPTRCHPRSRRWVYASSPLFHDGCR